MAALLHTGPLESRLSVRQQDRPALEDPGPWQLRAATRFALLGPPAAALIFLLIFYVECNRAVPLRLGEFLVIFFVVAVPEGYVLGVIPSLLAAILYCAVLTINSRFLQPLSRTSVAAVCGALASWIWFCEYLSASDSYGFVGALVMATLSVGSPRPNAKCFLGKE
jgi:hypothetical protein